MHNQAEDRLIRESLLGELGRAELEELEVRLMSDPGLYERSLVIQQELVDAFVEDRLNWGERVKFKRLFLSTPQGRQQEQVTRALIRTAARTENTTPEIQEEHWWRRWFPTGGRSIKFALTTAAIVFVCGLGLVVWKVVVDEAELRRGVASLKVAYRYQRSMKSRVSGFDWAPPVGERGSGEIRIDVDARNRAELWLTEAVAQSPSPAHRHALGQFYLLKGDLDRSIKEFREALKVDSKSAQLYSDLGAALAEKGKAANAANGGQSIEAFSEALESLTMALELKPTLPEALFNRALLLEDMALSSRAEEAAKEFLATDSISKWADEMRKHSEVLGERNAARATQDGKHVYQEFINRFELGDDDRAWQALSDSRNSNGSSIQNKLIDEWLAQPSHSEGPAGPPVIRYAANLEYARTGDRYSSDTLSFYETTQPKNRNDLANARALMRSAFERFVQSDCAEATKLYANAEQIFDRIGDTSEAMFTRYRLGHCYVRQAEREKARSVFEQLHAECERKAYRWLLAQCEHQLADIKMGLHEYSEAIRRSNHALQLFENYDTYGIVAILVQLADEHRRLNQIDQSFEYLARGQRLASSDWSDQVPTWGSCIVAAFGVNLRGRYRAALEYQTEALELALAMNRPLLVSRSYEYIALTHSKLGRYGEALDRLQRAFDVGKALSGELAGTEMMAHSALLLGDTYQQAGDPRQALKAYDQSVELYQKLGFEFYNYDANKGRLRSFVALGDNAGAEKEIETVMALLEEHRSKITAERYRNSFFDIEQGIVDTVIDYEYTHDQPMKAYEYSELCRGRSLLALMAENAHSDLSSDPSTTGNPPALKQQKRRNTRFAENNGSAVSFTSKPKGLLDVQAQMPVEAQLLQYSVLNNKVVVWVVTQHDFHSASANVESGELNQVVEQYLAAIKSASEEQSLKATELAGRLYEILVRPIEASVDKNKQIVLVPDKMLNRLPFQALVNPASGKYLLEDYLICYSPSSSAFIINSSTAKKKDIASEEQLLAVGGPSFERSLAQKFEDLPSARREAEQAARYYKLSRVLVGERAREGEVKSLIEKSDVVLIATHYDKNNGSPDDSRLLLAEEPGQSGKAKAADGVLTVAEILKLDLTRPRLVVLSACGTGVEQVFAGEGAISMARPFIAKGVPIVVASLWAVNSDATADLMIRFHRYRKETHISTASALRQAQLDAINGQDSRYRLPYYWAAFATIGGYAEF